MEKGANGALFLCLVEAVAGGAVGSAFQQWQLVGLAFPFLGVG